MDQTLTDAQKLNVVLKSVPFGAAVAGALTYRLLVEIQEKGLQDLDPGMWDVLAKTSPELQHVFMMGGLAMLLKSQEAILNGWTPTEEQLAKIKTTDTKSTPPKEEPDIDTFFPG